MAIEIFKLFGSIFVNNDEANKSISKTDKKASGVAETFSKGVKKAAKWSAAIVGGASAAVGGMMKMATSSASTADNIDKMSQKIGISRQAYQELDFICSQSGTSVDKLQNGMKSLRSAMDNDKNADIFNRLGIAITDAEGKMRSSEDVMWDAMSALQSVADADEKAALAQKLFGKSGQELMPLLNGQAGSIDEMKQKAHDLGLVMSDDMVDSGVALTDSLDQLKRGFGAIITKLGAAFMPIFQKVAEKLQGALPFIQKAIDKLMPVLTGFLDQILPQLFEMGEALLPVIFDVLQQLFPVFQQLVSTLLPVILALLQQLAPFFLQIVQQVLPLFVQLIQALMPFIQQVVTNILPMLLQMFQSIMPFLIQMITAILPVIIQLVQTLLPPVLQIVETVLPVFQKVFGMIMPLLTKLAETILPIIAAVLEALSPVIELLADLLSGVLGDAIKSITTLLQPFLDILNGLITFIGGVFKGDWEAVWNGIVDIFKGILNVIPTVVENVINGAIWIINRIIDGLDWAIEWTGLEIPHIDDVHLPRFRAGIDFVPYDKYPAYLDRGEAVLTAQEAEEYRKSKRESGAGFPPVGKEKEGTKTITQNFHISVHVEKISDGVDIDDLATRLSYRLADEVRRAENVYA